MIASFCSCLLVSAWLETANRVLVLSCALGRNVESRSLSLWALSTQKQGQGDRSQGGGVWLP